MEREGTNQERVGVDGAAVETAVDLEVFGIRDTDELRTIAGG